MLLLPLSTPPHIVDYSLAEGLAGLLGGETAEATAASFGQGCTRYKSYFDDRGTFKGSKKTED